MKYEQETSSQGACDHDAELATWRRGTLGNSLLDRGGSAEPWILRRMKPLLQRQDQGFDSPSSSPSSFSAFLLCLSSQPPRLLHSRARSPCGPCFVSSPSLVLMPLGPVPFKPLGHMYVPLLVHESNPDGGNRRIQKRRGNHFCSDTGGAGAEEPMQTDRV